MWVAWVRGEWVEVEDDAVRDCERIGIEIHQCDHLPFAATRKFPKFLDPEYRSDMIEREVNSGFEQIGRYLGLFG